MSEVLDKSGIFDLEVEFNPVSEANVDVNNGRIELQNGTYSIQDQIIGRYKKTV